MHKSALFISVISFIFFTAQPSIATEKTKDSIKSGSKASQNSITPIYIKNRNTVRITFPQLNNVKKISYQLTYEGNGLGQGVMGSVVPKGKKTIAKDIFLGTCSSGVCRQYKNIKNIKLQTTTEYKKGKPSTNTYKIKA